jgi:hypothetical protein
MPFIANRMGLGSSVICITQDEGQFIDTQALKLVKEFFIAMGYNYDHEKAKNTIQTVRNMETELNNSRWSLSGDESEEWGV